MGPPFTGAGGPRGGSPVTTESGMTFPIDEVKEAAAGARGGIGRGGELGEAQEEGKGWAQRGGDAAAAGKTSGEPRGEG